MLVPPASWPARDSCLFLYRDLHLKVESQGLLRRRHGWYFSYFLALSAAIAGLFACLVLLGNTWWQMVISFLFAIVFTHFAFLGHDLAHRQVVSSRPASVILGHVINNGLVGVGYGWWITRHSRHHGQPNRIAADPDIQDAVIVNTKAGVLHRKTAVGKFLVRRQGVLFFVLLPIIMIKLHIDSVTHALRFKSNWRRSVEIGLILVRVIGFVLLVASILPPVKAATFLLIEFSAAGVYLGCCFAPNHIGMPLVPANLSLDFLTRQVITSRNISGGPLVSFFMGGLNNQVEHHLFPAMPTPNLHKAAELVREVCAANSILYTEVSFRSAYREVVHYLNEVGANGPGAFYCPVSCELRLA